MLNEKIEEAINNQIQYELYSAYLYYAMSAYCQANDFVGMANWFEVQAKEEMFHASKFVNFINDMGGRVTLQAIDAPPAEWGSPLEAFKEALEHERGVTRRIHDLVALAQEVKDQSTHNILQWFVAEQVEEEATASQIVGQLKMVGGSGSGLFMVDQQLGTRVFTLPAGTQG